jgi:hypothetical protein
MGRGATTWTGRFGWPTLHGWPGVRKERAKRWRWENRKRERLWKGWARLKRETRRWDGGGGGIGDRGYWDRKESVLASAWILSTAAIFASRLCLTNLISWAPCWIVVEPISPTHHTIFGTSLTTTNLALYHMQTSFVCNLYKLQSKSHDVDPRRRSWEVRGVIYKNTFVNNLSHLPWVLLIIPPTSHGRPPWINIMWLRLKFA